MLLRRDKSDVIIRGQRFSNTEYTFLLNSFKESFSQASLSIEKAFAEYDDLTFQIDALKNDLANNFYHCSSSEVKKEINNVIHQVIVYLGLKMGVIQEKLDGSQKQIDSLYEQHFSYFDDYVHYFIGFGKDGSFDKNITYANLRELFMLLPRKKVAYDIAYNMKKDNLNAWDYAMQLDRNITIMDTIQINSIVNDSDVDKVIGFKKTNNDILSASFTPTDKKMVATEMQKLYAQYEEDFGLEILDPSEENISPAERTRRCYEIYKKEALFHIRFERIHPFNDGNGRTGRIILNHNLIKNHMPPVLITGVMSDEYKKFINDFDVDGLAKYLMASSSQLLTNWIGLVKSGLKPRRSSPSNDDLAKIGEDVGSNKLLRKIKSTNFFLLF